MILQLRPNWGHTGRYRSGQVLHSLAYEAHLRAIPPTLNNARCKSVLTSVYGNFDCHFDFKLARVTVTFIVQRPRFPGYTDCDCELGFPSHQ